MNRPLKVIVADDEARMREFFSQVLEHLGHQVVAQAQTGRELVEECRELEPDLIITDIKMPGLDGIDAAAEIYAERPVPIILVSAFHEEELIARAAEQHVLAYLVKPIRDTDLEPAITVAIGRFAEYESLRREAADARQALDDRKIIEKAKGILMKRAGLDEPEAFRRLQKHASSRRAKLVEVARTIVNAEETMMNEA